MQDYALRILNPDRTLVVAVDGPYLSDFSAIRAAQLMRRPGELAEVWRGDVCIFEERRAFPPLVAQKPAA